MVFSPGDPAGLYERRLKKQRDSRRLVAALHLRTSRPLAQGNRSAGSAASRNPRRVQIYSIEMAKAMNLAELEIEALRPASLLYESARWPCPKTSSSKPGPLTPDRIRKSENSSDRRRGNSSTVYGFPIRSRRLVLAHHERWDGAGYPHGLRGESIPSAREFSRGGRLRRDDLGRHHRRGQPSKNAGGASAPKSGCATIRAWRRCSRSITKPGSGSRSRRRLAGSIRSCRRSASPGGASSWPRGWAVPLELSETFAALKPALQALIPFETWRCGVERENALGTALGTEYVAGDHLALWSALELPIGGGRIRERSRPRVSRW